MALSLTYNSYASVAEADYYFEDRMTVSSWTNASASDKEKAIVSATRMIDKEAFVGSATSSTQALSFPRRGSFMDPRIGYQIEMDSDYDFAGSQPASSAGFPQWFHELPREVRYLKVSVYEQALWLIMNSTVINEYTSSVSSSSSSGAESTYKIGSIEVTEKGASAAASSSSNRTNPTYYKNLAPILASGGIGGSRTWFRSN